MSEEQQAAEASPQFMSITLTAEDWNKIVNIAAKEPYAEVFTIINQLLQQLAEQTQVQTANAAELQEAS